MILTWQKFGRLMMARTLTSLTIMRVYLQTATRTKMRDFWKHSLHTRREESFAVKAKVRVHEDHASTHHPTNAIKTSKRRFQKDGLGKNGLQGLHVRIAAHAGIATAARRARVAKARKEAKAKSKEVRPS